MPMPAVGTTLPFELNRANDRSGSMLLNMSLESERLVAML
jgi:hypothetical protein